MTTRKEKVRAWGIWYDGTHDGSESGFVEGDLDTPWLFSSRSRAKVEMVRWVRDAGPYYKVVQIELRILRPKKRGRV